MVGKGLMKKGTSELTKHVSFGAVDQKVIVIQYQQARQPRSRSNVMSLSTLQLAWSR
jgi:hypothetical protein